jgi:hypothetical protein
VIAVSMPENDPSNRPNVIQLLLQPFVNYNMTEGWYLVSSPIITANWEASSDNKWAFPLGAGIGKIFRIGEQPMNASLQAFDYLQPMLPLSPGSAVEWIADADLTRALFYWDSVPHCRNPPSACQVHGRAIPCSDGAKQRHDIIPNRLALTAEESVSGVTGGTEPTPTGDPTDAHLHHWQ